MPGVNENTVRASNCHAFFPECAKPYSLIVFLFSCSQLVRYFSRVYYGSSHSGTVFPGRTLRVVRCRRLRGCFFLVNGSS